MVHYTLSPTPLTIPTTQNHVAIQSQPLWIVFEKAMVLTLKNELMVNSYKSLDGRGAKVAIANGPCQQSNMALLGSSPQHVAHSDGSGGDAITVSASSNIWIDHCSLAHCNDGLVAITNASTAITVPNNYFKQHNKVGTQQHFHQAACLVTDTSDLGSCVPDELTVNCPFVP
ncbi:hypothetical protein RJ640_005649 [Escallonia rubra]|uniref:Pectate lyase n=1 Tax=Escallonia rubra TaxID=112253 RepID=A0AA88RVZ9_9ASTE|nr:hypothetical protein RJ640_005649 [Escallonia rubra]